MAKISILILSIGMAFIFWQLQKKISFSGQLVRDVALSAQKFCANVP